jgi:hypothetical protein
VRFGAEERSGSTFWLLMQDPEFRPRSETWYYDSSGPGSTFHIRLPLTLAVARLARSAVTRIDAADARVTHIEHGNLPLRRYGLAAAHHRLSNSRENLSDLFARVRLGD